MDDIDAKIKLVEGAVNERRERSRRMGDRRMGGRRMGGRRMAASTTQQHTAQNAVEFAFRADEPPPPGRLSNTRGFEPI